jgi:sugar transferase (PEP-CTERM/EpsH1 system associated)
VLCANHAIPPLVVHIIHRLSTGGLENGLVNLINHMPTDRYRHAIICLTEATDFRERLRRPDVPVMALHKRPGQDVGVHARLWRLLRRLRPAIVHTRNLATLECLIPTALARVPGRIHGEHGRDIYDLDGSRLKYNILRKSLRPLVGRYIAVSQDLARWLIHTVRADARRVSQIYNGVDVQRFQPRLGPRPAVGPSGFASSEAFVVGTVGRMEAVKDQLTLVRAFLHLLATEPGMHQRLRLVIIGDGALRHEAQCLIREAHAEPLAWLPGERADIPGIMQALDLFVLPSRAEGISNTILEAMASGLPVVATRVGGNPELVVEGDTGMLVPPESPLALASAIRTYLLDASQAIRHGEAARKRAEADFSIPGMVESYLTVYDAVLNRRRPQRNSVGQRRTALYRG